MVTNKRILTLCLALLLSAGTLLSACQTTQKPADSSSTETSSQTEEGGTPALTEEQQGDEPSFDDIQFPAALPPAVIMAEEGLYDYDDLTEHYDIEIMLTNYGEHAFSADKDPVNQWLSKQFNLGLTLSTPSTADYETTMSARLAANDIPDVLMIPNASGGKQKERDYAFSLSDQGLLVDARSIYPYMKHSNNYTIAPVVKWSINPTNGEIPFITKYSIQDPSVWSLAIRKDWLDKFGMDYPTTKEALMAYAMACTFDDPDGDGKDNTYFMTGNGNGLGFGMLGHLEGMFGNKEAHVENGQLQHQYFNGTRKAFLSFVKELYDAGVLAPDWYTMEWSQGMPLVVNDQVGMVAWPVGALYQQYSQEGKQSSMESLDVWDYYAASPIEGGKYLAGGDPGFLWGFGKAKFEKDGALDLGKIKRVAHMIDTMTIGGENYFQTVQGSCDEVYEAAGIPVAVPRAMEYTADGLFFVQNTDAAPYTTDDGIRSIWIWQQFGLSVSYQVDYVDNSDPYRAKYSERTNSFYKVLKEQPRWDNTALLVSLSGAAAEAMVTNNDWILAQEYAFATGGRSLDEYDAFGQEWLAKGGKEVITQMAEQLEVPIPDYVQ